MPTTDPRIDAYIRKAPAFARPILEHLRGVIHEGCPDVVESITWSMSHRREYVELILSARREETRLRRIALAVAQIAEGKSQNWKYERR